MTSRRNIDDEIARHNCAGVPLEDHSDEDLCRIIARLTRDGNSRALEVIMPLVTARGLCGARYRGNTWPCIAARHGHAEALEVVTRTSAATTYIDARDSEDTSALDHACQCPNPDVLRMLWLNCAYANVNATDNDGCTVLHRLCANNQLRGIRRLFASGWRDRIDPNIVDQSGHTPLLHAVAARHPAVVRALAAASIGVDFALDVNNDGTPLFHAALHAELVQELLTAGAPAQDTDALTYMCLLNQTTSVVRMLACGARAHAGAASVHHARLQRMTPLLAACRTQAYGLAKILLRDKRGRAGPFGVNYAPSCGNTALHVAAATSTKCARMLLKLPSVAVNARDCCGMTPLYKACVCDKRDTAMQLLARPDVDMDVVHNTYTGHYGNDFPHYAWTVMCEPGDTPLLAAIRNEMWDVVNCMYARGVDAALGDHRLVRDVLHGRRRRRKAFDRQRILRPLTVLLCAGRRRLRLPAELWMHVLLFARPQTWRYT